MRCDCGGATIVTDTRERIDYTGVVYITRARVCKECEEKFSTIELDLKLGKNLLKLRRFLREWED